jgi:hypothetical protein
MTLTVLIDCVKLICKLQSFDVCIWFYVGLSVAEHIVVGLSCCGFSVCSIVVQTANVVCSVMRLYSANIRRFWAVFRHAPRSVARTLTVNTAVPTTPVLSPSRCRRHSRLRWSKPATKTPDSWTVSWTIYLRFVGISRLMFVSCRNATQRWINHLWAAGFLVVDRPRSRDSSTTDLWTNYGGVAVIVGLE